MLKILQFCASTGAAAAGVEIVDEGREENEEEEEGEEEEEAGGSGRKEKEEAGSGGVKDTAANIITPSPGGQRGEGKQSSKMIENGSCVVIKFKTHDAALGLKKVLSSDGSTNGGGEDGGKDEDLTVESLKAARVSFLLPRGKLGEGGAGQGTVRGKGMPDKGAGKGRKGNKTWTPGSSVGAGAGSDGDGRTRGKEDGAARQMTTGGEEGNDEKEELKSDNPLDLLRERKQRRLQLLSSQLELQEKRISLTENKIKQYREMQEKLTAASTGLKAESQKM